MNSEENKIAVLIDAENVSYNDVDDIFTEIKRNGKILISRIYGNVNSINKWKDACTKYSIDIRTQFNLVSGKNTSDSKLIIDAMDILYTKGIDTFYIVSSDSDYTGLIMRIKEDNKVVIGMGETKTNEALINACNKFIFIENLRASSLISNKNKKNNLNKDVKDVNKSITPYELVKKEIINIVEETEENKIHASRIKELLINIYPDFDPRNYGAKKMSDFIEQIKELKLITALDGTTRFVILNCDNKNNFGKCKLQNQVEGLFTPDDLGGANDDNFNDLKEESLETKLNTLNEKDKKLILEVIKILKNSKDEKLNKSQLLNQLKHVFPKFKYKDYGVSSYTAFLKKFKDFIAQEDQEDRVKRDNIILVK